MPNNSNFLSAAHERKLAIHSLAEIIPEMTGDEYAELLDSTRDHGVEVPIEVVRVGDHFEIVDGRHRWRAVCDAILRAWAVPDPWAWFPPARRRPCVLQERGGQGQR